MITPETLREHKATWYVYTGETDSLGLRVRIPRQASMRGFWPGYDVECDCGWCSKTGGGTKRSVAEALWQHRYDAQTDKILKAEARAAGYNPSDRASYRDFLLTKVAQL